MYVYFLNQGIGNFKHDYNLELKSDVIPLLDQLKTELSKLENMGIIKKVNFPTDWVNYIVEIKKT